ncbi:MAG: (d)CMP kinase [Deltaproteobacteria bacterium]|jgi:cytidylate kinase|nr:(d)CMP kinase [Deltaproteobacteria bacterium]
MDSTFVIAIDGPAGSGKSTLARKLAASLGWRFLDTGVLYRAMAVAASSRGLADAGEGELTALARSLDIRLSLERDLSRVSVDGLDVTGELRTQAISALASRMASMAGVRDSLRDLQRRVGAGGRLVTEGRDQGTAIFPEARLKFFLVASPEARAGRRLRELQTRGRDDTLEQVLAEMLARDRQDAGRRKDPLREAPDAVRVDSTDLDEDQVLALMLARAREVFGEVAMPAGGGSEPR